MSIEKVVAALNGAFAADPGAMRALVINHVPCNMGLVNDPYVICEEDRNLAGDHFTVGMLGVINGVLAAAGMTLVAAKWDMREDGPNIFAGFIAYIQPESVSSDEQTPEPDQYWQYKKSDDRVYFIGRTPYGEMVWQCEGDNVEIGDLDWSGWERILGCTGWDWKQVPPVEFPQYAKGCCGMIFRADSPDRIFWLPLEGGEHLQDEPELHWAEWSGREPLSEFEIGEIINRSVQAEVKSPSDVMGQSPEDWVEITDPNHIRRSCDFVAGKTVYPNCWEPCTTTIGFSQAAYPLSKIRCLRKDLPVVKAHIPVSLYWYDGAIVGRYADSPVTDPSFVPIHSDGNGGWFIERSEDAGN